MARRRKYWFIDKKRDKYVGRFHDLAGKWKDLCSVEDALYIWTSRGPRKRSVEQRNQYLNRLWKQALSDLLNVREDVVSDPSTPTLMDAVRRYNDTIINSKSLKHQQDLNARFAFWMKELGPETEIGKVAPAKIASIRDALSKSRSPATVNRYLAALSALLSACVREWFLIENNPCKRVSRLKEPKGRIRFLSENEIKRLLEVCKHRNDLHLAVLLALSTGARQAEVWGLKWSQVDFKHRRVNFICTKNDQSRGVFLNDQLLQLLSAQTRRLDSPYVFPSKQNGKTESPLCFKKSFKNALEKAGISDFTWHDLRHTAASYLAMSGATLREIADILGHKTLSMVMRYSHLTDDHNAEVLEKMHRKMLG